MYRSDTCAPGLVTVRYKCIHVCYNLDEICDYRVLVIIMMSTIYRVSKKKQSPNSKTDPPAACLSGSAFLLCEAHTVISLFSPPLK